MTHPIKVTVNGSPREFSAALTFDQFLDELSLSGKRLAIELNGEIVPRSRYGDTAVDARDRLEIVGAVGGG